MTNENLESVEGMPAALRDDWEDTPFVPDDASISSGVTGQENVETPPVDDEAQHFITIDRRKYDDEVRRLLREDESFRSTFNREVGVKAKTRYDPRIKELEAQIEYFNTRERAAQLRSMPQEEVSQRSRDPEFAREYSALALNDVPSGPTAPVSNPVADAVSFVLSSGQDRGLTEDDLRVIATDIQGGKYDKDEFGTELQLHEWREGVKLMQRDVDRLLVARLTTPITPSAPSAPIETPPVVPTRTDTATPDMSNPGNRGSQSHTYTLEQVRQMSPDMAMKLWPTIDEYEAAIANGIIKLPD